MIDRLLSLLAPHLCYDCRKVGGVLCDNCKYNITSDDFTICIMCETVTSRENICTYCRKFFEHAWCVAPRREAMKQIVNDYKFNRLYAAHQTLAELLAERTPVLPANCTVVPIPTIASHIRQRGYDHVHILARAFAKQKGVRFTAPLIRKTTAVQTGQTKKQRQEQANQAFSLKKSVISGTYVLIDDVVTTGSTLKAAALLLREHGADEVWAAIVAHQPLD